MNHLGLKDHKREYMVIKNRINPILMDVIKNGRFILGKDLEKFEINFAKYCDCTYAVGVASGTAALYLALLALGIKKGDEVITTPMSFNATAEAITFTGATPVFVDVRQNDLSIDADKIESSITKRTKVILPVHLYGVPAEMDKIGRLCKKYKLFLVEDCAQAHGTFYHGRHVGSFGDVGCFSFMPSKNLGCYGDSGGVVTNNEAIAKKIKKLRDHGRTTKYTHDELGYAERMDNLQGAVLDFKLKFLDKWNLRRQEIADIYDKNLNKSKIRLIKVPQKCRSSYYAYTIFVFNREEMAKNLKSKNIDTGIHFPVPLHLQPVFRNLGYKKGILPVVEKAANEIISLPIHPFLKDSEVKYIISQVNKYA